MADEILTPMKIYIQADNIPSGMVSDPSFAEAVNAALLRYSEDIPQEVVGGFVGDGTGVYDLSAKELAGWTDGVSEVVEVDCPWVIGEDSGLDFSEWDVVDHPTWGRTLWLFDKALASTDTIQVRYTTPWTEAAIPARHVPAVAMLAAAGVARMLAARMAQSNESTLSVDGFHSTSNSQQWLNLAKMFEGKYEKGIGFSSDSGGRSSSSQAPGLKAASIVFSVAPENDDLTHD